MTLGVRALVLDDAGRVLLVRHTYTHGWHLPGGGVEHGETAISALLRELAEEAGVEPTEQPRLIGFHANHANFPNDHIIVYKIEVWRAVQPANDGEIAERAFFAPDRLPEGATMGTRRRIAEALSDANPSAAW